MELSARAKSLILSVPGIWIALIPYRLFRAFNYTLKPRALLITKTAFLSREVCNHSYRNTEVSIHRLAALLANIEGISANAVLKYCAEIEHLDKLQEIYREARAHDRLLRNLTDEDLRVGRQLLYYCLARALRPRLVFEAGTAQGIGSLLILQSLQRNEAEGYPGRLITVDLNPNAGRLLRNLPSAYSRLMDFSIGNSETALANAPPDIDLFLHETVNIASHEMRHYELLHEKLSPRGVICTPFGAAGTLEAFSSRSGRRYLEFTNEAQGHWCSDTVGISLPRTFPDRLRGRPGQEAVRDEGMGSNLSRQPALNHS